MIICFWTPTTSVQTDTDLVQWGLIDITLTSASTYVKNVQIEDAFNPNVFFSLSGASTVSNDVFVNDTGCNDTHSWTYDGNTIQQAPSVSGIAMFSGMNTLSSTAIDITWGDTNTSNDQNPGNSYSHQFTASGDYTISTITENVSGLTSPWSDTRRIYWNPGAALFTIDNNTPDPVGTSGLGETVTFTNTTVDVDGRMNAAGFEWTWDWDIIDTGAYGTFTQDLNGQAKTVSPTHQWRNPGNFNITLTLNYYDGFDWQTNNSILSITQGVWSVSTGLTWPEPVIQNVETVYTPNITGDTTYITDVDYNVNTVLTYPDYTYTQTVSHTFSTSASHTIRQIINYHTGFASDSVFEDFSIDMGSIASFTYVDSTCGGKIFSDTSTPGLSPISYRLWEIINTDTSEVLATLTDEVDFNYNWYQIGNYTVRLTVEDSSTPASQDITSEDFNILSCGSGAGAGGRGGGLSPNIVYREKPRARISIRKHKDEKEEKPKITIILKDTK